MQKNGHKDEAMLLAMALQRLDASRKSDEQLISGRRFKGYRTTADGKGLFSMKLSVEKGTDEFFTGVIERDFMFSGHPVYEMTG